MPKFKDKVIRKDEGGFFEGVVRPEDSYLRKAIDSVLEGTGRAAGRYSTDFSRGLIELMGGNPDLPQARKTEQEQLNKNQLESSGKRSMDLTRQIIPSNLNLNPTAIAMAPAPKAVNTSVAKSVNTKKPVAPVANVSPAGISKRETDLESEMYQQGMGIAPANLTNAMSAYGKPTTPTIPDIGNSIKERIKSSVAAPDMAKAAGALPKTKSGMKKFMDEYGKFIALGALSGAGGKKGAIAAPIMAALPGILKMLQNRGKKTPGAPAGTPVPGASIPVAHGGLLSNKSAAHPKKKMAGGAIRKFNGGSMNTFKYRNGGESKQLEDYLPASTLIPDDILFNDTDAAKQMLGRPAYEQDITSLKKTLKESRNDAMNLPSRRNKSEKVLQDAMYDEAKNTSFPSASSRKSVKTSPRKYSPRKDYQSLPDPDVESMSTKYLEDAPDLGSSSNDRFISGIDERTALPMVGPNRSKRSLEDAIYASAKDSDYDIPADSIPTGSSVPKTKSGLKKFFSMMGKGLGIKKKSRSNDEGSQSLYAGGAVRKFKGGSMNTMKDNLVPKYKNGGDMPKGMPKEMMAMMGKKGKATGDMPEHKKMDMGMPIGKMPDSKKMGMAKPKPSSMNQKFAKGGTAKYASGGMCKGYGIAKKIRSTGVMN